MKRAVRNPVLRISRAIWLRGNREDSWLLRSSDHKMCCLGIYLEACGVSQFILLDKGAPGEIYDEIPAEGEWLLEDEDGAHDSMLCCQLMEDNDSPSISEAEREERIILGFGQQGITVEFTE